ncbi:MAG: PQQ-binding-like beta-propeller repeat protein, partial [Pirellulales bacterium]
MHALLLMAAVLSADSTEAWPAFRGDGDSLAIGLDLPQTWSATENIAWSIDLQGYGQSSPIIWGDSVLVTSVDGEMKDKLLVACHDLATGERRWLHEAAGTQKVKSSEYVSRGAPTPAVDNAGVYAFFESGDLIALDHAGKSRWTRSLVKDYGEFQGNHGIGTSVVQTSDAIILLIDHAGPSYLIAFSKSTGETLWKVDRESRVSWSTPLILSPQDKAAEIVLSSNGLVEGYRAADGQRLWWLGDLKGNTVASPTAGGGFVVVGSSAPGQSLALRRGEEGELGESAVVWRTETATSSFASPLVHQDYVYFVSKAGLVFCLDAKTGKEQWNARLGGSCWASPIGADERVYFFLTTGETVVMRAGGGEPVELARNTLPD